jgi:acylphosphatase
LAFGLTLAAMSERRIILFSGRVQGVGFRMTAIQLAADLPLAGTVRNLDDGGVELVAEGEPRQIDVLVERLREQFGSYVRSISQRSVIPTGLPGRGIHVIH